MKHLIWSTLILVACSGYDDSDDGDYGSDDGQDSARTTYVPARGTTPGTGATNSPAAVTTTPGTGSGGSGNRSNGGTGGSGAGGAGGSGGGGSGGSMGGIGGGKPAGTGGSGSTPNPPSPAPTTTSQPSTPTPPAIQCHRAESCVTASYSYPTTGLCGGFMVVTVTNNCTESVYVNVEATGCDSSPGGTSGGLNRVRSGEKWGCSLANYYPADCDAVHFRAAAEDDDARCYLFD